MEGLSHWLQHKSELTRGKQQVAVKLNGRRVDHYNTIYIVLLSLYVTLVRRLRSQEMMAMVRRFVLKGASYNPIDVANCLMVRRGYKMQGNPQQRSLPNIHNKDDK